MVDPVPGPAAPTVQAVAPNLRRARRVVDQTGRERHEPLNVARPFAHPDTTPPKTEEKP